MTEAMLYALVAVGAVAAVGIGWLVAPKCPSCEARFSARWQHQRKDGGPDLRFKDNRRFCSKCGDNWPG